MSAELRYEVYSQRGDTEKQQHDEWAKACEAAVRGSMSTQTAFVIDVFAPNRRAARRFGGSNAVERYERIGDPNKVFERIEIRADSLGGGY